MFAVIAINAPARGGGTAYRAMSRTQAGGKATYPGPVFHYHILPELVERLAAGQLVEAPFGDKAVQGIIVGFSEVAPVSKTRPVTRLLFDAPLLSSMQLDLGLWLSDYYLAPLIDCLRLMLPPGLLRRPQAVLRLHPEAPAPQGLPAVQQQIVELVQAHGVRSMAQLAHQLGQERAARAVRALVRRGVLIRGSSLPAPRARPRRVNFVRLIASPPQVQGVRPLLGRPSAQAAVLQALLDMDDPLPSPESVLAWAGASSSTLSTLARKGWVTMTPERVLIQALPAAQKVDLGRAHKQRAVVAHLLQHALAAVDEKTLRQATGASAAVLRALQGRRLIQRLVEPAVVLLALGEQQTRQEIVKLRGAARQNKVLDYLLGCTPGEWVWVSWVYAETGCALDDLRALEGHGLVELAERELVRDPLQGRVFAPETKPPLTGDQARVWREIEPFVAQGQSRHVFLLHGVTGSGKTEIYMRAVEATLGRGRQAIVLVPEISLTPQAIRRFAARFPDGLGVIHSGLSDGERYDTWRRIRAGQVRLVIGPRSALLAPLPDIGLIVLDEEHDASYKQGDVAPTYHARDVALKIAEQHGAVVVLGSATPDLTTFYRAREGGDMRLLRLPRRILADAASTSPGGVQLSEALPPVRVIDMRQELRAGNRSMFSRVLQKEMRRALAAGEQTILFLNRRGTSTFVLCRDCGAVIRCPRCDIPLTYHGSGQSLTCHHCNYQQAAPQACPLCQSRRIRYFGVGTQRVEDAVRELLPGARILRWDRDATRAKGSHQNLLDLFTRHQADLLIGTQMIAKGLDLPLVTLVGVIAADTALNLPDFRAAERTFQLLVQVAGRAGRSLLGGNVVVQTYTPEHYAIQTASQHNYGAFYAKEREFRRRLGYPPFSRLARLVYSDANASRCRRQADALAEQLREAVRRRRADHVRLIGPAPCFFKRLRGRWRWQIVVCAPDPRALLAHIVLPAGWRLDIDPVDIL